MLFALLSMVSAVIAPETAEVLNRAATLEAGRDGRFDVVSELDVKDLAAYEANRQLCGASSESCTVDLAGALDARFVLFLSPYSVGDDLHVGLVLRDLTPAAERVVFRGDITGTDDKELFAAVQRETRLAIDRVKLAAEPSAPPIRLFVGQVSATTTTTAATTTEASTAFPWGPVIAVSGAAVVVGGGLTAGYGLRTYLDPNSSGTDKTGSSPTMIAGGIIAGVGVAVVVVGAVVWAVQD